MYKKYIAAIALTVAITANAADYSTTLKEIVNMNLGLQAAKKQKDAVCQENLTGLNLSNPEVGFSYQWGSPTDVPDKKTIDVTQQFDLATLTGSRKRYAESQNVEAAGEYAVKEQALVAEVDRLMTECVGLKRKYAWQQSTIALLKETEEDIRKGMKHGIYTRLDLNSASLMRRNAETEAALTAIDIKTILGRLTQISAGKLPEWDFESYLPYQLPADIESYARDFSLHTPTAALASAVANSRESEITLRKRENLPNFSLGYTAEMLRGDNHHGVAIGVELPLWGNRGKVKAAQAAKEAAQLQLTDEIENNRLECIRLYQRASLLLEAYKENTTIKNECDNRADLLRLFETGKISYSDYRQALLPLLEMEGRELDAEQAYQMSLAEFRQGIF